MTGELSRRAVLGGTVAGVAGALLSRVPARAATTPSPTPTTFPGGRLSTARVGATLNLTAFASDTNDDYPNAVDTWNDKTGTKMSCWKIYYQPGDFGKSNESQAETMINRGIEALISVKPAISGTEQDRNAMAALLRGFSGRGL